MKQPYRHILYYSPSHIQQLFFDRVSEHTRTEMHDVSWSKLQAGLSAFLPGNLGGEKGSRKEVMKSVNHSEDYVQTKQVVNLLLDDSEVPRIKNLNHNDVSQLHRFSCECQIIPETSEYAEDSKLVEVVGREGDIEFRGLTSLDNWSSLSDTLMMMDSDIPYPFTGIVQVQDLQDQMLREEVDGGYSLEEASCSVNFVFICQAEQDEIEKWRNRRSLVAEYHESK
jgi:hypothetical protein